MMLLTAVAVYSHDYLADITTHLLQYSLPYYLPSAMNSTLPAHTRGVPHDKGLYILYRPPTTANRQPPTTPLLTGREDTSVVVHSPAR